MNTSLVVTVMVLTNSFSRLANTLGTIAVPPLLCRGIFFLNVSILTISGIFFNVCGETGFVLLVEFLAGDFAIVFGPVLLPVLPPVLLFNGLRASALLVEFLVGGFVIGLEVIGLSIGGFVFFLSGTTASIFFLFFSSSLLTRKGSL